MDVALEAGSTLHSTEQVVEVPNNLVGPHLEDVPTVEEVDIVLGLAHVG